MATRPSAVCRRGYAEIRGQINQPTHPCLEKKHDGGDHDGGHPLHSAHQTIPSPLVCIAPARVDGEESAGFQSGTIDAPLCAPLDCWDCSEKKRAHFLCEIDEENPVFARFCFKPRSQISTFGMYRVAPGYVSSLNRACFAPQKAMFRTSVRHVSQR